MNQIEAMRIYAAIDMDACRKNIDAMLAKLPSVRIIHGKGTGVLRKAVQQHLKRSPRIKSVRLGVYGEGEDGVTIAELDV